MVRQSRIFLVVLGLAACSPPAVQPLSTVDEVAAEEAVLELADSVLAAARARDADRFAGFFSDRPGFVYLINTRRLSSPSEVRSVLGAMLARQEVFDIRWGERDVQVLAPGIAVVTGEFTTRARRVDGTTWDVSGVVTFVAAREPAGWRVVSWHTSE